MQLASKTKMDRHCSMPLSRMTAVATASKVYKSSGSKKKGGAKKGK